MSDSRLTILLVEDNEDDYIIVRDLLSDIDPERFTLEWAASYADGLRAIQGRRHDLILLDHRLSDGNGLTLLQETQASSGRPPVIFMTGQGDHDIDIQAMQAGAADYLVKDRLDAGLLERAIRYAVERQRAAEALRTSEERYRAFVADSSEGIWRFELERPLSIDLPEAEQIAHLDRYAYVAECNEAMARIYGFESASELIGAGFSEFLWNRDVSDDNYPRRLIRNQYRLVSIEAFEFDRSDQPKYIQHNLMGVVEDGLLYRLWSSQNDVTERKRFEGSQAHLATIVETSDDAIFSKTREGQIVTWNGGAEALYGYAASEMTGQLVSLLIPPHCQEQMSLIEKRVSRGERIPQFETVRRHKDGKLIDVSLAISPIINAAGEVTGSSSIARDITERKRAEASLIESRQRLALATESARIGVWDWDVATNGMFWDAQMYSLYGVREQEFSGAVDAWQNGLHPEDRDRAEAELALALDGSRDFHTQFRVVWPCGEVRHIEAHGTVQRAEDDSPLRMIGVNWDITERKTAEESLVLRDKAIRASRNGIVLADMQQPDRPLVSVNPAFEQMSGYSADEVVGRNCRFLQGPDQDQPALEPLREAMKVGLPIGVVLRNYRKDGTPFWNELFLSPIYDASGTLTHYVGVQSDITERKQAEEERDRIERSLRQSERRFRSVLAKVESLVIHDVAGRVIEANQNACDSLGYTREDLLKMRVQDYASNYDEENITHVWEQMVSGETDTLVADGLHRRKDGTTFPVEVRLGLMEMDGAWLLVTVARDVTDRKKAQDALREAEQEQRQLAARLEVERARLAEAQEIAKVGSWELDLRTDTLTWSDENYRIFEMDPTEFKATYKAFLERVHPEDRAALDKAYADSLLNHTPYDVDHRIRGKDGGIKFVHERCQTLYDDEGRPIRSVGTTQDVTANHNVMEALRKSEHEFRRIVETTHEGVLQLDEAASITYANQRFCDMLGYTADELQGCSNFDLLDKDSLALARQSFEERRAGLSAQIDLHYRHKDGSSVWTLVSASPLLDEDGRMIGAFGMINDITERKRLENQVRQSEKLAALGEMVAGVAHEINNPLAAILGNAELLEMHADPQVRQDAQTIQRMSQRVTRIVRSLLTFARPQKEERREEALNTLVEHTLEMTTHNLRTANVCLSLHLQQPSPVVSANANEIQQVLLNLIMNAEHALRRAEGGKCLVISTGTAQVDGRLWATASIADNGHGISDEIRARIFDPFFTTKDVGEGTGLGLSICHGIAEAHGGKLSVESAVGVGTTFTLALPPAVDRSDAARPQPLLPESPHSGEES